MSMEALRAIRPVKVPAPQKSLLWALADQANPAGEAWPSIASLIEATCLSERTIQAAIAELRKAGMLATEPGGGRNRTTLYKLILTAMPKRGEGPNTPQHTAETPQMSRGIEAAETPQELHETPQLSRNTPQEPRQTPQLSHPNPQEPPLTPKEPSQRAVRAKVVEASPDHFEDWWSHYPRKVGKDAARKAYAAARKRGASDADLAAGLQRQRWPSNPQYIPHAATWLNGGRWQDDPTAAVAQPVERISSWDREEDLPPEMRTRRCGTAAPQRFDFDGHAEEIFR